MSVLGDFLAGAQGATDLQARQFQLEQSRQQAPQLAQMRDIKLQQAELDQALQRATLLDQSFQSIGQASADPQERMNIAIKLAPELEQFGVMMPVDQLEVNDFTDEGLNQTRAQLAGFLRDPQAALTTTQSDLQSQAKALVGSINPDTGQPFTEETALQSLIRKKAGIDPRAGMSAQERIASDPELTEKVAGSQATIKRAEEAAKLGAKIELEPELARLVETAKQEAKSLAAISDEQRSNQKASQVYNVGISTLAQGFEQATTGGMLGFLPAIGADARALESALSLMAPLLKDVFRSAGEGTFTDADQKILIDMMPSRKDGRKVAMVKLEQLDSIVQAKLGGDGRTAEQLLNLTDSGEDIKPKKRRVYNPQTGMLE